MGGVWERLIRSVRSVLKALVGQQVLNDEGLLTLMAEVERIVNSRPITAVSNDKNDPEPLTPSHLLTLRANSSLPYGAFDKNDRFSLRWWRQIQFLSSLFWKRWVRDYLPSLQCR